jgi:hypothetical protein
MERRMSDPDKVDADTIRKTGGVEALSDVELDTVTGGDKAAAPTKPVGKTFLAFTFKQVAVKTIE